MLNTLPKDYEVYQPQFIHPIPEPSFIYWLFRYKCVMCKKPASEINEIIPRSRSKKSILDWRNRVPLCQDCHRTFHLHGVTQAKIDEMQTKRKEFLLSMDRKEYV